MYCDHRYTGCRVKVINCCVALLLYSLFLLAQNRKRKKKHTIIRSFMCSDTTAYYRTVFFLSFTLLLLIVNGMKANQIGSGPLSSLGSSGPLSSLGSGQYSTKFSTVFSMLDEFIGCENYYTICCFYFVRL